MGVAVRHQGRTGTLVRVLSLAAVVAATDAAHAKLPDAARARIVASARVGADVVDTLDAAPTARVIVAFNAPSLPSAGSRRAEDRAQRRSAIGAARARIVGSLAAGDFTLRRGFDTVEAMAGDVTPAGLLRLLDDPTVVRVDLDSGGTAHLAHAVPLPKLDQVHALGFTGAGVTVAVIDSGIDTDHADLSDSLVDQQCFCSGGGGCCPGGGTTQSGAGSAEDDNGHGTNVAGIITSNGTVAPGGGAPDA